MDPAAFANSPVGRLLKGSHHDPRTRAEEEYWAFAPSPLAGWIDLEPQTIGVVADASMVLGSLDAAVRRLPNPDLLVRPALRREARSTAALEGTYAAVDELVEGELVDPERLPPRVREVLNYYRAVDLGIELLAKKPLTFSVVAPVQKAIVEGTPDDHYDAGQMRQRQVVIGDSDQPISDARFVPCPPGDELRDGISDWEKWVHREDDIPILVRTAGTHYQFETLHPFSNGNGRVGRLIIILQLMEAGALAHPILTLSAWFDERKEAYKNQLLEVSRTGDFNPWVQFFCRAVSETCAADLAHIDELLALQSSLVERAHEAKLRGVAVRIATDLIAFPVIDAPSVARRYQMTYPPVNEALGKLERIGLVREITGGRYARRWRAEQVMEALRR